MFQQLIHRLAASAAVFSLTAPMLPISFRLGLFLAFIVPPIFLLFSQSHSANPNPSTDCQQGGNARLARLSTIALVGATCLIVYVCAPKPGFQLTYKFADEDRIANSVIFHDRLELKPSMFPLSDFNRPLEFVEMQAIVYFRNPMLSSHVFAGQGDAFWEIDGESLGVFESTSVSRNRFRYTNIDSGIHEISFRVENPFSIPIASIEMSEGGSELLEPLKVFFPSSLPFFSPVTQFAPLYFSHFLFAAFLVLLTERIVRWPAWMAISKSIGMIPSSAFFAVVLGITFWIVYTGLYCNKGYEADEAAFGLMAQDLAKGQCPPPFHYGQNYQGIIESIPLSALIDWFDEPRLLIDSLPVIWKASFILISVYTFYRFGSLGLAAFSLLYFALGGIHFHWIFSKGWFGYSFALIFGSVQWLIAFIAIQRIRPSIPLLSLWSFISGLSFYELPLSFPFTVSSGLLLAIHFLHCINQRKNEFRYNTRRFIFFHLSVVACSVFFISIPLFPYALSYFENTGGGAVGFLSEGRQLPPPRVSGENPFSDRFLEECWPTLTGVRYPFDQQFNMPSIAFPGISPVLLLASIVIFPFVSNPFRHFGAFFSRFVKYCVTFFALLTLFAGVYSPFGIWPWYFLPIYWVLPVFLFTFFRSLAKYSISLCVLIGMLYVFCMAQSKYLDNSVLDSPNSVLNSGIALPVHFGKIFEDLRNNGVEAVLCDQGFDAEYHDAGRDWIGECLTFHSKGNVKAIDRLSRRRPDIANEAITASRVGYLFHNRFYYNKPDLYNPTNYIPLSINNLNRLFGPEFLDYHSFDHQPYRLFVPKNQQSFIRKADWELDASYPFFLRALADHNISVRSSGRDAYWSSDNIPDSGGWISVKFKGPKPVKRIVLFHGTKEMDFPRDGIVTGTTVKGNTIEIGTLKYDKTARSSKADYSGDHAFTKITIHFGKSKSGNWLTIYEMWII